MASTATKKKSSNTTRTNPKQAQKRPIRREVWAVVCFFIGLFSFIGYFDLDAVFITYVCAGLKGLIGYGYYLLPPVMFACALILFFHHGKPVKARTICLLFIPVSFGALLHLLLCKIDLSEMQLTEKLPVLYENGRILKSGGLVCGLLANLFRKLFSVYGAVPFFIIAFFVLFFVALKINPAEVMERIRSRERIEYSPEPEKQVRQPKQQPLPQNTPVYTDTRNRRHAIDIPMDDNVPEEDYVENRVGFFNTNPRVKTPDKVLLQHQKADAAEAASAKMAEQESKQPKHMEEPKTLRNNKTNEASNPTVNVSPLTIEEAADIAGVVISSPQDLLDSEELSAADERQRRSNAKQTISKDDLKSASEEVEKAVEVKNATPIPYIYPPVDLLHEGVGGTADGADEIRANSERLQQTLDSFGVAATICDITRGPTVTRYDLELSSGVKLAKLTNLAGDLALSLGVSGVRIAPIPDKISTVGIEVPNRIVSMVYLRDIIDTTVFQNAGSKLTFALGKDIGGNAIVGNIAKLPHLLIAGTTGSGKSVCMNSLILSLLYKATPEEVRLIMIDPKMVELGIYNGIPHLYVPVVTDPKKAAGSLQWSVIEMLKRYRLFSEMGVRDLTGYNTVQKNNGLPILPQVVIVIDELADLMMTAAKEVEESICRVAQMGRAAGMHLVIATQRPSADVITGLMKANIPSRIAFAVSSAMESRIILDQMGAEKLVGNGDMLYSPLGIGKPTRIQGAFVSDEEREDVVNFVKQYGEADYNEEIMASIDKAAEEKNNAGNAHAESVEEPAGNDYDELLPQAVDVIFETKQASVSMLQRRLKLGYSRAARIVDQMEEIGVVGPFEGSKPRQILITREEWLEMQASSASGNGNSASSEDQMNFADFKDDAPEDWSE